MWYILGVSFETLAFVYHVPSKRQRLLVVFGYITDICSSVCISSASFVDI